MASVNTREILVIGAGVIGLSTTLELLLMHAMSVTSTLPSTSSSFNITVIADQFTPHTTSDGAGGFWTPYKAKPEDKILRWAQETQSRLDTLLLSFSPLTRSWPISIARATTVSNKESALDLYFKAIARSYVVEPHGAGRGKHAVSYDAHLIETSKYMETLMSITRDLGVKFIKRTVSSIDNLVDTVQPRPDLIINCSGLGAHTLVPDSSTFPLRGILVLLRPQEHMMNRIIDDDDSDGASCVYVISRRDLCILGGTAIRGDWSENASQDEIRGIIARCSELAPELGSVSYIESQVSRVWVGLRPGRDEVRLELDLSSHKVPVVHNYGHGGSGWTLHWGCAQDAANLAWSELHRSKKSKL